MYFFFAAINFSLFHLNFWTLLKDTETCCFKAFKAFVLLFYDHLEAEQNLQFPVSKPLLLPSCILKLFDPLAARPPFELDFVSIVSVTCGRGCLWPVFSASCLREHGPHRKP